MSDDDSPEYRASYAAGRGSVTPPASTAPPNATSFRWSRWWWLPGILFVAWTVLGGWGGVRDILDREQAPTSPTVLEPTPAPIPPGYVAPPPPPLVTPEMRQKWQQGLDQLQQEWEQQKLEWRLDDLERKTECLEMQDSSFFSC